MTKQLTIKGEALTKVEIMKNLIIIYQQDLVEKKWNSVAISKADWEKINEEITK